MIKFIYKNIVVNETGKDENQFHPCLGEKVKFSNGPDKEYEVVKIVNVIFSNDSEIHLE